MNFTIIIKNMIPDVTTVSYVHLYQNPIINRRVTVQNRILYKLKEVNFWPTVRPNQWSDLHKKKFTQ